MYTIRVYYNPTCTVCQSAEKSCKCHYFQLVFKQRNISFICGLHYSAFEYPRRQKKSAKGTLVWRRERDSNPCEIALKRFSRPPRYDHFDIPPYKRNYEIVLEKTLEEKTLLSEKCVCFPQIRGFFADCFRYGKEVSRPPRYDRFDTSPYMNCRQADFIGYSIVLEILLEMRFCAAVEVPKKSGVARLFTVFATAVLANFQDRLVMATSISLRVPSQPQGQLEPKFEI